MVHIPFRLVDVFTDRPLAGNQLCVVPEPVDIPTELMQSVAREIGFSETTFVTQAAGDHYSMRIFTPTEELPFAGHPTLGTAFVLVSEGHVTSPAVQHVGVGEIPVEVDLDAGMATMHQLPPRFGPVVADRAGVGAAVGLGAEELHPDLVPEVVSTGLPHLIVAVSDERSISRARPDPERLIALLDDTGADGYYLFHSDRWAARARMFAQGVGVEEDAATGSAAGPLGAYLAERGVIGAGRLVIAQGVEMSRPSTLLVDVERGDVGWRIAVGGGVAKVGAGWFELPD